VWKKIVSVSSNPSEDYSMVLRWCQRLARNVSQHSPRGRRKSQTWPRRFSRLAVEALEDRTTPTATLFLDFGDSLPAGGLTMTVLQMRDTFANGGIQGPDLTKTTGTPAITDTTQLKLTPFNPLVTFDYNGDAVVNAQDATDLRTAIVSLVQHSYNPLN